MRIDLGDVVLSVTAEVPGLHRYQVAIRVGPPSKVTERRWDESSGFVGDYYGFTQQRKVGPIVDLQADKKVRLDAQFTDEVGNPTEPLADASMSWTVDDPSVINLQDNGDGSVTAAATGTLGTVNVHLEVTAPSLPADLSGDLQIVVVAGLAERVAIAAGEPEEATPDGVPV